MDEFLSSVPDCGEWLASQSSHFIPRGNSPGTH